MGQVAKKPGVMDVMGIKDLTQTLARLDELLTRIQKSLADYLEGKRASFPRFYFVGDDDLLEIIGSGKDPAAIQRHLRKMFAGIQMFTVDAAGACLVAMQSAEGEFVALREPVAFSGETEVNAWLSQAEVAMRQALCASLEESVKAGVAVVAGSRSSAELFAWMDASPAQVALRSLD